MASSYRYFVVPANAGTHNPGRWLLRKVATTPPEREAAVYGSRRGGRDDIRSRVGRRLGRHQKLGPPHPLEVRGVEAAGDDEHRAGHGPDIRYFAEHNE